MSEQAKRTQGNMMFLQFENVKVPEFKSVNNKDWVLYGEKNNFPDYLIDCYLRSGKHNSIINAKVNYICGKGWEAKGLSVADNLLIKQKLETANKFESYSELTRKVVLDLLIFGGYSLEIIWDKKGKNISEIYHIPFNKIRTNKDESIYYYSNDWSAYNQSEEKTGFKELVPFDPEKRKGKQVLTFGWKTPRVSGQPNVYPLPDYIGGLAAIETDIEIANFHLSNIKTGFSAGTMINLLDGRPTDEEAKKLERQFKEKFTGSDRAGSLILNFAADKEHAAEVLHLQPSDLDKQYIELAKRVQEEIFVCHKITSPMLFGIKTEGQLGGNQELQTASQYFQNTYTSVIQGQLNKQFNYLMQFTPYKAKIELMEVEPVGYILSDADVSQVMTLEEKREMLGLKKKSTFEEQPKPRLIDYFKKYGRPKDKYKIVKSRQRFSSNFETQLYKELFEITDLQKKILSLLEKDNLMTIETMADVLKVDKKEISKLIRSLKTQGLLEEYTDKDLEENPEALQPTEKAEPILDETPQTAEIFVLYSYEWRDEVPVSERDTTEHPSREFCKELMSLNKFYTRDEIEQISNETGYSVWMHQGGYWNRDGKVVDHCRHTWQANIVSNIK